MYQAPAPGSVQAPTDYGENMMAYADPSQMDPKALEAWYAAQGQAGNEVSFVPLMKISYILLLRKYL